MVNKIYFKSVTVRKAYCKCEDCGEEIEIESSPKISVPKCAECRRKDAFRQEEKRQELIKARNVCLVGSSITDIVCSANSLNNIIAHSATGERYSIHAGYNNKIGSFIYVLKKGDKLYAGGLCHGK